MSEPLAYFITWTTYGTWLPGDGRGWVEGGTPGIQAPDARRREEARVSLAEPPVTLDAAQREVVRATVEAHCRIRGWRLHAVNVRSNHVHVVVTAPPAPEQVMNQLKAWCSRRLNEQGGARREHWWTYHGSTKWINDEPYLRNSIRYVTELQ
jgi:REP element-mobilizing transposase RayT